MESRSTPRTLTSPTSPRSARCAARPSSRAAPLALLGALGALLGCSAQNGPWSANATITVDAGIASAQASFFPKNGGGSVDFTGTARMTLDGVALKFTPQTNFDDPNAGTYHGDVQALSGGQPYTFELDYLDGVEMASFSIPMVQDAQIVAPASDAVVSTMQDLVVRWSNADVAESDQIQLVPAGGSTNEASLFVPVAAPGLAATIISAEQLRTTFLFGTQDLVLTRTRTNTVGVPFTGGSVTVTSELSRVRITIAQ